MNYLEKLAMKNILVKAIKGGKDGRSAGNQVVDHMLSPRSANALMSQRINDPRYEKIYSAAQGSGRSFFGKKPKDHVERLVTLSASKRQMGDLRNSTKQMDRAMNAVMGTKKNIFTGRQPEVEALKKYKMMSPEQKAKMFKDRAKNERAALLEKRRGTLAGKRRGTLGGVKSTLGGVKNK